MQVVVGKKGARNRRHGPPFASRKRLIDVIAKVNDWCIPLVVLESENTDACRRAKEKSAISWLLLPGALPFFD
jgi:hypothetical protein